MDSSATLARARKGRKTVNKKVAVRRVTAARGCVCGGVCVCVGVRVCDMKVVLLSRRNRQ